MGKTDSSEQGLYLAISMQSLCSTSLQALKSSDGEMLSLAPSFSPSFFTLCVLHYFITQRGPCSLCNCYLFPSTLI